MHQKSKWHRSRGYTLVEMMLVVIIAGVLGTLGVYGVRRYVYAAKTSEALHMINSIKGAQETYLDATFTYLDVSQSKLSGLYPMDEPPGKKKYSWFNSNHVDSDRWRELGVTTNHPVQFGYAVIAGDETKTVPQPGGLVATINFPSPPGRWWYVVKAVGDQDGDGEQSVYVGSSFTSEIYGENESE